jgi:hypothetical protein
MPVEPTEKLKSKLPAEIVDMIMNYNQRAYEINSQRLCEENNKYDPQLMNKYHPILKEIYEEERQKLKNYAITSSRIYTENQEMDISAMEKYFEDKLTGYESISEQELASYQSAINHHLYEEALRRMEFKRDYLFLEKVIRYYRISVLIGGGLA